MRTSTLFLVLGLCLCTGISAQFSTSELGIGELPRFSRLLKQDVGVATYLLPREPTSEEMCLPSDPKCCQADSYASPYSLVYQGHKQQQIGGRYYTTFFYSLTSAHQCYSEFDSRSCCSASVNHIWVDVDPTLKVKYVAVNGVTDNINSQQNEFGLKIGNVNKKLSDIPSAGLPITVTVQGYVDALCPPPAMAPLPGTCEVMVQGGSTAEPEACCPVSVTRNTTTPFTPGANDGFQCTSDLSRSAFKLELQSVGAVYSAGATWYRTYHFRMHANEDCSASGALSDCCNARLHYIEMKITDQAITDVKIGDTSFPFSVSTWNEPAQTSYRSLLIDNLAYTKATVGESGMSLTITMRVPSINAMVPDLCDADPSNPNLGACHYYMHSEDGLCCPSGQAMLSGAVPPPPAGTCTPTTAVAHADTSMSLQFYEKDSEPATTTFTFLLANHNGGTCKKSHCTDVCSWSLYIRNDVATSVSVGHESSENNGRNLIIPGQGTNPAEITFTYGPLGESTLNFFVNLPRGGRTLSDLCARNALPGQGSKACAAIVRSKDVYIMVFFDESDIMIPSPPVEPTPGSCPAASDMDKSCMRASGARFNPTPAHTTFSIDATAIAFNSAASATCDAPAPAGERVTVRLFLASAAVDQLSTKKTVRPATRLTMDRTFGLSWVADQTSAAFAFSLSGALGVSDVCRQGVTPDHPANTCAVEISGPNKCFRGFVAPTRDGSLAFIEPVGASSDRGVAASTVVPAVVIPVVAVLVASVLVAIYMKRRRAGYSAAASDGSGSGTLERPLNTDSAQALAREDISMPSASPSDVQIRVKSSAGGAPPQ